MTVWRSRLRRADAASNSSHSRNLLRALPTLALLSILTTFMSSMTPILAEEDSSSNNNNNTNNSFVNSTASKSNANDVTTCPIIALLPFTNKGTKPNTQFSIHVPVDHMAATLLAIDHFNSRDASVVSTLSSPSMASCDVTIPTIPGWTIMDDGDFTTNSVAGLLKAREERDICGVVGPYRNKAALGAGHLSGAMEVPMLSYGAADSAKLGRLHLYPMTIKMTADEYDRADAVMDYLKNYKGRDYVTLLHTTDLVDHAVKVLDWAAKKHGVKFWTEAIKSPFTKIKGPFR